MSASADLQKGVVAILQQAGLPAGWNVIARREKELKSDIEAAVGKWGGCLFVMPPIPTSALQMEQPFVFFDRAELRVRILEQPALNKTGYDAYDLIDAVALALHWTNPGGVCAHPIMLASRPVEMVESPTDRLFDVIFTAQYQLNPP